MTDLRCGAGGKDELYRIHQNFFPLRNSFPGSLSNSKAKTTHTATILLNHGIALLRWIGALGVEHAFVPSGFLVFAHAARLF